MSVLLRVDLDDPTPPYEQLRRQLALSIETGQLRPDERLPALRQLAGDLGLAVGTVGRTYRELESAGLVRSRRGGGTRVVARGQVEEDAPARLHDAALTFARVARALGASPSDARRALDEAWSAPDRPTTSTVALP